MNVEINPSFDKAHIHSNRMPAIYRVTYQSGMFVMIVHSPSQSVIINTDFLAPVGHTFTQPTVSVNAKLYLWFYMHLRDKTQPVANFDILSCYLDYVEYIFKFLNVYSPPILSCNFKNKCASEIPKFMLISIKWEYQRFQTYILSLWHQTLN